MRNQARRIAMLLAIVAMALGVGARVIAHSGLGAASPAPGATVGGEINEIELRYNRTVSDVTGSVTDPDGNVINTEFVQDGNLRVTILLAEPLSTPGQHAVRHISTDVEDRDRIEAAYLFTYDPSAPPPQLAILPDDDGFPWIWVVVGIGVLVIAALTWRLFAAMHRAAPEDADDSSSTPPSS